MPEIFGVTIGPAQIAAILVLMQRGGEELLSMKNTRALLEQGAHEVGAAYYPVVAATHLGWLAAIFFLIPADAPVIWPLAGLYLGLQVARYWVIATIGKFWTHRIITLPGAALVKHGIYGITRHPNYAVTRVETPLLAYLFGAWALGTIFAVIWWLVLAYKIELEDEALAGR